jgi:DNA-binding MarR family transcriptional regulator
MTVVSELFGLGEPAWFLLRVGVLSALPRRRASRQLGDRRDVRSLRSQLELDSGYLSRLLRSLEAAGLITVERAEHDGRVRIARLTLAGSAERDVLEQRSDELAASLLQPLSARQRSDLVRAMADIERLMTAAMVEVAPIDPAHPHAQHCLQAYFSDLDRRFDRGFDPSRSIPAAAEEMRPPAGHFLLASLRGEPVGCGALKFHDNEPADLKRMWVAESARGLEPTSTSASPCSWPTRTSACWPTTAASSVPSPSIPAATTSPWAPLMDPGLTLNLSTMS